MKFKLFIFSLLLNTNIYAIDSSVFEENYPGFHDYEAMSLVNTRSYFRSLFSKSVVYNGVDGVNRLDVKDVFNETLKTIRVSIERELLKNEINETVIYTFENGEKFIYILKRKGAELQPTTDLNLLMLKFQSSDKLTSYDLQIPAFKINFHRDLLRNIDGAQEKSYFILGMMDFNIAINTQENIVEVNRDYIYFYKGMNPPEQILTVNAHENQKAWQEVEFVHSTRGFGVLTPKQFNEGVNGGTMMFIQSSQMFLSMLYSLGFPKFN